MKTKNIIRIGLAALLTAACGPDKDPIGERQTELQGYPTTVKRRWSDQQGCQEYRIQVWDATKSYQPRNLLISGIDVNCDGRFEDLRYHIPSDHSAASIAPAELSRALKKVYE